MPNKQIGANLYITEKTVKTHANNIFRRLGVNSRLQATLVFQSYQRARAAKPAGRAGRRQDRLRAAPDTWLGSRRGVSTRGLRMRLTKHRMPR